MEHDPLCPVETDRLRKSWCQCALIARVRADERRVAAELLDATLAAEMTITREEVAEEIAQAIIEAGIEDVNDYTLPHWITVDAAVAIARRIGGTQ